jgi:hypothetical protein
MSSSLSGGLRIGESGLEFDDEAERKHWKKLFKMIEKGKTKKDVPDYKYPISNMPERASPEVGKNIITVPERCPPPLVGCDAKKALQKGQLCPSPEYLAYPYIQVKKTGELCYANVNQAALNREMQADKKALARKSILDLIKVLAAIEDDNGTPGMCNTINSMNAKPPGVREAYCRGLKKGNEQLCTFENDVCSPSGAVGGAPYVSRASMGLSGRSASSSPSSVNKPSQAYKSQSEQNVRALQQQLDEVRAELEASKASAAKAQEEAEELREAAIGTNREEKKQLLAKAQQAEAEARKLRSEQTALQREKNELQGQLNAAKTEFQSKAAALKQAAGTYQAQAATAEARLAQAQRDLEQARQDAAAAAARARSSGSPVHRAEAKEAEQVAAAAQAAQQQAAAAAQAAQQQAAAAAQAAQQSRGPSVSPQRGAVTERSDDEVDQILNNLQGRAAGIRVDALRNKEPAITIIKNVKRMLKQGQISTVQEASDYILTQLRGTTTQTTTQARIVEPTAQPQQVDELADMANLK